MILRPAFFQTSGLFFADLDDGSVFLFAEIAARHDALVEVADGRVVEKVAGFCEAEVVWMDAVIVVHHHPAILADAFPAIGRLVTSAHPIVIIVVHAVRTSDICCRGMFDGGRAFVRHIIQMENAFVFHNVAVDDAVFAFGRFE